MVTVERGRAWLFPVGYWEMTNPPSSILKVSWGTTLTLNFWFLSWAVAVSTSSPVTGGTVSSWGPVETVSVIVVSGVWREYAGGSSAVTVPLISVDTTY